MTVDPDGSPSHNAAPRRGLRVLLWHVGRHRSLVVISIALSVAGSAFSLAQPLLVSRIVTDMGDGADIVPPLLLLLALVGAAAVVSGFQTYALLRLGEGVVRSVRKSLTRKVFSLSFTDLGKFRRADLVARATTDTVVLKTALTQSTTQLVGGAIMFVGAVVAMAFVSPSLLGVTLSVVAMALAVLLGMSGRLRRSSIRAQESMSRVASSTDQYLRALKTLRSLNAQERAVERMENEVDGAWRSGLHFARISAMITPLSGVVLQVALAAVLGFGGYQVSTGTMSVAQLIAFIMYLFLLLAPLGQAISATTSLSQALAVASRLREIEAFRDTEPLEAGRAPSPHVLPPAVDGDGPAAPAIEFDSVTFGYEHAARRGDGREGDSKNSLQDVSFAIPIGARVGIVGPSGAGKSTLLALISRFYDPDQGEIRINGMVSRATPRQVLRAQIGLVEQDAPVVAGTLRENLMLGAPHATMEDCVEVLARVNLSGLLARAKGLDVELSDEGSNLSGGERQRLAIARALLADRQILLLDESTSQMDSENERLLRRAISDAARDRTLVVVAHRLSTVIDSDIIFVVRAGSIEARGTHRQLLERSATYRIFAHEQHLTRVEAAGRSVVNADGIT